MAEISDLNLHDFGIFIELEPDEEQQAQLEKNIQIALQSGGIDLEDAIDLREIKNIKLANQMLKERRRRKQERDQRNQQANIQAQAQANAKASEASALAELQKQQGIAETTVNVEKAKSQLDISEMMKKAEIDKQLMEIKFSYDMQLKQMDLQEIATREKFIEDRKDKRTKLEGTQQSKMISQRANNSSSIDFEDPFNSLVDSTQGVAPNIGGEQPM